MHIHSTLVGIKKIYNFLCQWNEKKIIDAMHYEFLHLFPEKYTTDNINEDFYTFSLSTRYVTAT